MSTQAHTAGPGRDREVPRPARAEAAGPACPRLVWEEVTVRIHAGAVEAQVRLAAGRERFTGLASSNGDRCPPWQLAAAATVSALQRYLQQRARDEPAPRVQLAHLATATTGIGQQVVTATLALAHGSYQTHLLGTALVRNDWCSTAVAAALDAASRRLGLFAGALPPAPSRAGEVKAPEPRPALTAVPSLTDRADTPSRAVATDPISAAPKEAPSQAAPPPAASQAATASLGLEITPTSVRAVVVGVGGQVLSEARQPSRPSAEPDLTVHMALEAARAALGSLDPTAARVAGVGVAAPGRLRPSDGVCVACGDFPAWHEVQLTAPFADHLGMPASLIGTIQAAALAEVSYGAARGLSRVVLVHVGPEIGLAVVLAGQPLSLDQAASGQAGHMVVAPGEGRCACGESGCWQALAGREAMVSRVVRDIGSGLPSAISAAVEGRLGAVTPALICRMAAAGDAVARNALEETGRYLALGLGNLIALFDPEAIILESAPPPVGAALRHAAETALKQSPRAHLLSRCVLLAPSLGDLGPALGAAAWAAHQSGAPAVPAS